MMRPHRQAHRALWPLIALLIVSGFVAALTLRPPQEAKVQMLMEPRK
jgi:hypothetical protein